MQCPSCKSSAIQLIKVMAGSPLSWAPANAERDIFGNYKKTHPLHAHACGDCGHVFWNIRLERTNSSEETAMALDALADEVELEEVEDPPMFLAKDE